MSRLPFQVDNGSGEWGTSDMATYELGFEVATMSSDVEDAVAEELGASVATHSGLTTVTLVVDGPSCLAAALVAADRLQTVGAPPLRLVDDLVSRGEIARRVGVTPQAVGNWIRGDRHPDSSFPTPYVVSSTELWLWGEVRDALRKRGLDLDRGLRFPTRRDSQLIGGALAVRRQSADVGWSQRPSLYGGPAVSVGIPRGQVHVDAKRTEYALAT